MTTFRTSVITAALASIACSAQAGTTPATAATPAPAAITGDWLSNTISPVNNPVFFEDPTIRTELRPIYMHHRIDDGFITKGGDVNLYALQFRYAITDRLGFIATKDGYVDINPGVGQGSDGWADVALGCKYALIDDRANQFILTPGFTFDIPLGDKKVFLLAGSIFKNISQVNIRIAADLKRDPLWILAHSRQLFLWHSLHLNTS